MTRSFPKAAVASMACALLPFSLAACSGTESAGQPVPTRMTTTADSTTSPGSTSATPALSLDDISPCDLLTAEDQDKLGVTKTEGERQVGSARSCGFITPAGNTGPAIRTNVGLDGVTGATQETTVGSHKAKIKQSAATDGCGVYLGVSDSSRVDVVAIDREGDVDQACDLAMKTAELVEKNLPES